MLAVLYNGTKVGWSEQALPRLCLGAIDASGQRTFCSLQRVTVTFYETTLTTLTANTSVVSSAGAAKSGEASQAFDFIRRDCGETGLYED